ncbi:MAG: hypothetical protein ACREFJ_10920 [Acetobacteraceae bacterium]
MTEAPGIRIEVPEGTPEPEGWGPEFDLPWGGRAQVRPSKGRDFRLAQMGAGEPFDEGRYDNALTARLSRLDGKQATFEQIEALAGADFLGLKFRVQEASSPPPRPAGEGNASSSSPTSSS